MNRQPSAKNNVPDELRDVLLEFTISYLLEQPPDVLDYAVEFFTKLRDNRTTIVRPPPRAASPDDSVISNEEDDEPPVPRFNTRRKSVFAEAYDPEADDDDTQKVVFPKSDEQRQGLAESVKKILLFRSLDKEQMHEVLDAMFEKRVKEGDYIIKQGDDGDNFYVIQTGTYHAYVKLDDGTQKLIHTYHDKGSFGELALLYNQPRAATIQAGSEGSLWALDRQTFRRIILKSAFKKRKMYESLIDCVPMLKTLQSYERLNLADALIPRTYEDGDLIIKQGDAADGMYFVEAGTIKITIFNEDGKEVQVKEIKKGGYFGELALVTHKPRAASAYAVGTTKLAFLDVEAFERLLGPCMEIMKRNIDDYESQLEKIFGSKHNITDVR
ncbi:cAMP-dependent protein kinase type II regulatory subunit isoform X2 [Homalodisca vitripennis]|nr:cAMP-dependent protein kinase type II regulatory subunit isoform X1 [Homalodisca vitripennis]XP_046662440.1 cAMP-dependent protein kinase type II regulatory subunit isoform X2 [Homalodisca vitripennis]